VPSPSLSFTMTLLSDFRNPTSVLPSPASSDIQVYTSCNRSFLKLSISHPPSLCFPWFYPHVAKISPFYTPFRASVHRDNLFWTANSLVEAHKTCYSRSNLTSSSASCQWKHHTHGHWEKIAWLTGDQRDPRVSSGYPIKSLIYTVPRSIDCM